MFNGVADRNRNRNCRHMAAAPRGLRLLPLMLLLLLLLLLLHPALSRKKKKKKEEEAQPASVLHEAARLVQQGDTRAAMAAYADILSSRLRDAHAQSGLSQLYHGIALSRTQRFSESLVALGRAATLQPALAADVHNHRGNAFSKQSPPKLDEALHAYHQSLLSAPDSATVLGNVGNILQMRAQHAEALAKYDAALRSDPSQGVVWGNRGSSLRSRHRTNLPRRDAEAEHSYMRSTELLPSQHASWTNLATLSAAGGRHDHALRCLGRARAIRRNQGRPPSQTTLKSRGDLLSKMGAGRRAEARSAYKEGARLGYWASAYQYGSQAGPPGLTFRRRAFWDTADFPPGLRALAEALEAAAPRLLDEARRLLAAMTDGPAGGGADDPHSESSHLIERGRWHMWYLNFDGGVRGRPLPAGVRCWGGAPAVCSVLRPFMDARADRPLANATATGTGSTGTASTGTASAGTSSAGSRAAAEDAPRLSLLRRRKLEDGLHVAGRAFEGTQVNGYYSIMRGAVHVWPHCGPDNSTLRMHLPLAIPEGDFRILVKGEERRWLPRAVLTFDDGLEHEVVTAPVDDDAARIVFILDVTHPDAFPEVAGAQLGHASLHVEL